MKMHSATFQFDIHNAMGGSRTWEGCKVDVNYAITQELEDLINEGESMDIYNMLDQISLSSVVIPEDLKPYVESLCVDEVKLITEITGYLKQDMGGMIEELAEAAAES